MMSGKKKKPGTSRYATHQALSPYDGDKKANPAEDEEVDIIGPISSSDAEPSDAKMRPKAHGKRTRNKKTPQSSTDEEQTVKKACLTETTEPDPTKSKQPEEGKPSTKNSNKEMSGAPENKKSARPKQPEEGEPPANQKETTGAPDVIQTVVTKDPNEQEEHESSETMEETSGAPDASQTITTGKNWTTVQSKDKSGGRKAPRHGNTRTGKPTFCEFPVIIAFITEGSAKHQSLDWRLTDKIQEKIGTVRTVKPLASTKILVGCSSQLQQERLEKVSNIGGTEVRCTIPVPTVEGVVRGIPTEVSKEDMLSRVESILDMEGNPLDIRIRGASRLTYRDGNPSRAFRMTFVTGTLPTLMKINKREYEITPYVAEVQRCYRCHRFGHIRKDCGAKQAACPTCGQRGHAPANCKATSRYCVNCGGPHSATYKGCPARKEWALANKLRAESYMPRAQAMQQAKKAMTTARSGTQIAETGTVKTNVPSAWKPERGPGPRQSFADIVAKRPGKKSPVDRPDTKPSRHNTAETEKTADNQALKAENKLLKEQIERLQSTITELQSTVKDLANDIKILKGQKQGNPGSLSGPMSRDKSEATHPKTVPPATDDEQEMATDAEYDQTKSTTVYLLPPDIEQMTAEIIRRYRQRITEAT